MKLHSEPPSFAQDRMWSVKEEWWPKSSQSCGRSKSCQSKSFKALFVESLCEERKDLYVQQLSVAYETRITFCFAFLQELFELKEASNSNFKMASEMPYCLFAS